MLAFGKISLFVMLSICLTVYTTTAFAQTGQPVGILDAIRIALNENPKIRANDKTLEAMALRVQALKNSRLPSLRLGTSATMDQGQLNDGDETTNYRSKYTTASASLNWNLFDGGALRKRIQSAECSFKERQASFNSTNALIRNTQGQIASIVVENYVSLVDARENIKFIESVLQTLYTLRTAAKSQGEVLEAENFIAEMTLNLEQLRAQEIKASRNYEYVVTQPAPQEIESFQQMINSLVIPASAQEALQIAYEKSPEIKTARYQIECNRLKYDSAKASAYSPKIDVSVGYGRNNQNMDGTPYNTQGPTAGLSFRMTLDPGSSSELKAHRKEIDSAQDNLDGTIADTRHNLATDYPDLQNSMRFAELHHKNFLNTQANVQKYLEDIAGHKTVSVSDALKQVSSMINNWYSQSRETTRVLNKKFQIQKTVGTLFENLGLNEMEINRIQLP